MRRLTPVKLLLRRLLRERIGNVTITFALMSLPLFAFTGMAIDYGLGTRLQVRLQAANDATVLSLCQTPLATPTAALQLQAQTTMSGYMGSTPGLNVEAITITSNPRKIFLRSHAKQVTFFSGFVGDKILELAARSQCGTPMPKTFEIAMVLDNTGSMASSSGSQSKIQALQSAATSFIDYVVSNSAFASNTRLSIVPFAAAVAVDPTTIAGAPWIDSAGLSPYHWTNVDKAQAQAAGFTSRLSIFAALKTINPAWGWAGCFETLPYPNNVQDGAPTSPETLYVPLFAPDEPGDGKNYAFTSLSSGYSIYNSYIDDSNGAPGCTVPTGFFAAENQACKYVSPKTTALSNNGPNTLCVSKPLQRLTTNTATLKSLINSLTASGSTNIHEGLMWGWRTLSPLSVFADGAPYNSTTGKVIILMTDGANTWPVNSNSPNGSQYFTEGYVRNADGSTPSPHLPPSQGFSSAYDQRKALDALTLAACTNAKAAGISIYTIGFSVPSDPIDTQGKNLLTACATSSSQAFVANDSSSLIGAFNQIAQSIGALRLTQ